MERGSNSPSTPETDSPPSDSKPQPPIDAPAYAIDPLDAQDPALLGEIAQYASELADWKAQQLKAEVDKQQVDAETIADDWDDDEWKEVVDDAYEKADIPRSKGSITINQIDGRGYYYLKWSSDGEFKSQYVAPVDPKKRGSSD